jgi:hypothetical protein
MRRLLPSLLAACVLCLAPPGLARSGETQRVDLELVLAVDVSLSMDADEQRLQREGYVAAFRDPAVHRAIASGAGGRIAVAYIEWAGEHAQETVVPWTLIDGPAAARAFAEELAAAPPSRARMTSISSAISYAAAQFEGSRFAGLRRVIDVSGDGPNNAGRPVAAARAEALASGIVINGLPILAKEDSVSGFFDIARLDDYYRECVIGGPGAFVVPITASEEFAPAIRQKLILEISGAEVPSPGPTRVRAEAKPAMDCMVGERLWQRYIDERLRE